MPTLFADTSEYLGFCPFASSGGLSESSNEALQFWFSGGRPGCSCFDWVLGCELLAGRAAPRGVEASPGEWFWVFW